MHGVGHEGHEGLEGDLTACGRQQTNMVGVQEREEDAARLSHDAKGSGSHAHALALSLTRRCKRVAEANSARLTELARELLALESKACYRTNYLK